jgi:hypothetical protein
MLDFFKGQREILRFFKIQACGLLIFIRFFFKKKEKLVPSKKIIISLNKFASVVIMMNMVRLLFLGKR